MVQNETSNRHTAQYPHSPRIFHGGIQHTQTTNNQAQACNAKPPKLGVKQMKEIGISLDEGGLVCLECFHYYQDEALREGQVIKATPNYEEQDSNPDGYTCATCGDEWYPKGYIAEGEGE